MFRRRSIALTFLFGALCAAAAAPQDAPAPPPTPSTMQAEKDTESDLVVARISGEPITEKQVLSTIEILAGQTMMMATPERRKQRNILLFKGALDNLAAVAMLKNQARKQSVKVDQARIDEQIQKYASRYPSQEEFESALAAQGITEAEMRKSIEESLSMQEVLDSATKNVPVATDSEIQKFYNSNPDRFPVPEKAHVAQIFLKVDQNNTPEQKTEIKNKLEAVRADIEASKIGFAEAAVKFSEDSATASKGGDMGFIPLGRMMKPLEEAVFATIPGRVTPVIESQTGFHILRVIELKPAAKATLEEARPAIKQYLDQNAKQKAIQKYMQDLKSKASIEMFMTAEEFDRRHPVR